MSFRCNKCDAVAQRPNRVVVERKMVQHASTENGPGRMGSQIVAAYLCDACAGKTPEPPIERVAPEAVTIAPGITLNGEALDETYVEEV